MVATVLLKKKRYIYLLSKKRERFISSQLEKSSTSEAVAHMVMTPLLCTPTAAPWPKLI
jgi:hypothetical protein